MKLTSLEDAVALVPDGASLGTGGILMTRKPVALLDAIARERSNLTLWTLLGSIDEIFFWDPAMAGEAQLQLALMLAQGQTIEPGTDLGVPGYNSLTKLDGYDNVFVGNAALVADAETVSQYHF